MILPKSIHRLNATPIQIPAEIFIVTDELTLKFTKEHKGSKIDSESRKTGRVTPPNYYKITTTKIKWLWHNHRHKD